MVFHHAGRGSPRGSCQAHKASVEVCTHCTQWGTAEVPDADTMLPAAPPNPVRAEQDMSSAGARNTKISCSMTLTSQGSSLNPKP